MRGRAGHGGRCAADADDARPRIVRIGRASSPVPSAAAHRPRASGPRSAPHDLNERTASERCDHTSRRHTCPTRPPPRMHHKEHEPNMATDDGRRYQGGCFLSRTCRTVRTGCTHGP